MIDTLGLTDRTIGYWWFHDRAGSSRLLSAYAGAMARVAHGLWPDETRRVSRDAVLDYVFARRPDLVVVTRSLAWTARDRLPSLLLRDPRLRRRYRLVWEVNGFARVYERGDIATPTSPRIPEHASARRLRRRPVLG